jgi:hypothetical protein
MTAPQNLDFPVNPADLAAGEVPEKQFYRSCPSHCCVRHGCKYAYKGCPVKTGQVTQDHPCEQCTYEIDDAAYYGTGSGYSKPGEVGYSLVLGLKRIDAATGEEMVDMPTSEQVNDAVREALAGLTVNGWSLTRILGTTDDTDDTDDEDDDA